MIKSIDILIKTNLKNVETNKSTIDFIEKNNKPKLWNKFFLKGFPVQKTRAKIKYCAHDI